MQNMTLHAKHDTAFTIDERFGSALAAFKENIYQKHIVK
jgi:hypothetical protein